MKALKKMHTVMRMIKAMCEEGPDKYKATYMNKSELETIAFQFITSSSGEEYGITYKDRLKLAKHIIKGHATTRPLSYIEQHFWLVDEVLKVPKSLRGDVVECGCYNGGTTIGLSWACALTNRKLIVCDSFQGLPKVKTQEKYEIYPTKSKSIYIWEKGEFRSEGGLKGVKKQVRTFGKIEVCQFVKGYFKHTLKTLDTKSIVFIFEDADLKSSVETCVRYLWPKLQLDCKFVSHEPWSINVVSVFYDEKWWQDTLGTYPPGFYGSGYGVKPISGIGFAQKFDREKIKARSIKRRHWGSNGFEGSALKAAL
jgi:hypothetical protein